MSFSSLSSWVTTSSSEALVSVLGSSVCRECSQSGADHVVDDLLLLRSDIDSKTSCTVGSSSVAVFCLRFRSRSRRRGCRRGVVLQLETGVDDRLVGMDLDLAVGVRDLDVVDQGAGIGPRQNQRESRG